VEKKVAVEVSDTQLPIPTLSSTTPSTASTSVIIYVIIALMTAVGALTLSIILLVTDVNGHDDGAPSIVIICSCLMIMEAVSCALFVSNTSFKIASITGTDQLPII
jgi:hypothetical protein